MSPTAGSGSPFEGVEGLEVMVVNVGQSAEDAAAHLDDVGVAVRCLLDSDERFYAGYALPLPEERWAPFPIHVVIDRDGVITYLNDHYDADALQAAVQAALDAG